MFKLKKMETFKVTVPEDKKMFFIQFLELIGATFKEENVTNVVAEEQAEYLSKTQQEILEKRLSDDSAIFLDAREEQNKLKEKYGL